MSISTKVRTHLPRDQRATVGQVPCGRKGKGKLSAIEILNTVENDEWTILQKAKKKFVCSSQKFK